MILLSLLLAVICVSLRKVYGLQGKNRNFPKNMPPDRQRALRYLADNKDEAGNLLALCSLLLISTAAVLLARQAGLWAIPLLFGLVTLLLLGLPAAKASRFSGKLAEWLAPPIRLAVEKTGPLLKKLTKMIPSRFHQAETDSGVYTLDDLKDFLKRQKHSAGNTIDPRKLDNLLSRLEFEKKKVKDLMQTRKKSTTVGASDAIGPVLIDELHKSGQQYFLVEEEFNSEIIGTLDVAELVDLKKTGDVKNAMDEKIYYLKDKWTALDALEAYFKTGSAVFVVINSDEDIKGIVSIKDVLNELVGQNQTSGFESFDSPESVSETDLDQERTAE